VAWVVDILGLVRRLVFTSLHREVGMERLFRSRVSAVHGIWSGQAFHVYRPSRKRREVGMERLIRSGIVEGKEVCSVSASGQVL
jgi:hypothetical protein